MVDTEKGITHIKNLRFYCGRLAGGGGDIFWRAVLQDVNEAGSTWLCTKALGLDDLSLLEAITCLNYSF